MKFKTYSGSVYELDEENKRVRRLSGANDPTPRQGPDGTWREYTSLGEPPQLHHGLLIVWKVDDTDEGAVGRCTRTSYITEFLH